MSIDPIAGNDDSRSSTTLTRVAQAFELGTVLTARGVNRGAMGRISRVDTTSGVYAVKELFA